MSRRLGVVLPVVLWLLLGLTVSALGSWQVTHAAVRAGRAEQQAEQARRAARQLAAWPLDAPEPPDTAAAGPVMLSSLNVGGLVVRSKEYRRSALVVQRDAIAEHGDARLHARQLVERFSAAHLLGTAPGWIVTGVAPPPEIRQRVQEVSDDPDCSAGMTLPALATWPSLGLLPPLMGWPRELDHHSDTVLLGVAMGGVWRARGSIEVPAHTQFNGWIHGAGDLTLGAGARLQGAAWIAGALFMAEGAAIEVDPCTALGALTAALGAAPERRVPGGAGFVP